MRRLLMLFFCFTAIALSTTACNTVEGVGEDLSSAARGVKEQM